jgi:hypothetical protein
MKTYKITPQELSAAKALQIVVAKLQSHERGLRTSEVEGRMRELEEAYWNSPNDSTFQAYRNGLEDWMLNNTNEHYGPRLRYAVETAISRFVRDHVRPFALPLLETALTPARKNLAEIQKQAHGQLQKLTGGHPLPPGTRIKDVEEATKPVSELENLQTIIASEAITVHDLEAFFAGFFEIFG